MVANLSTFDPSLKTMGFLTFSLLHIPLNIMQPLNVVIAILLKQSRLYVSRYVDFVEHHFPYSSMEIKANRPESNTIDIWVPSHHIIPFTSSPSSNSSHAISSTSDSGSISHEVATSNRSSSDEPENSITSFPGMSSSTSSSTSASSSSLSVPTHSTSSVPSSAPIPNHSMVTRSKNNISKPIQRLCLNATLSSKAESSPAAQPSKLQATSSNSHCKSKPTRSLVSFNSILKPIEPRSVSQALKDHIKMHSKLA
ncbi:hypothetical protein KY290_010903 [Solanum tuberosum]|uniref:Uncharacterized protein n=1 Tax=Solanum tuberosum TaxID=4113 RepID=A0ABQ7VZ47_SOLTU|nr:hypothetical protein KY290_010903 [Solanum tuberosum]